MSREINFFASDKSLVVSSNLAIQGFIEQVVTRTMYSDRELTNKIGILTTIKDIYNVVPSGTIDANTLGSYKYIAEWEVPGVDGSSLFNIYIGNSVIVVDGDITIPDGIYYGAANGVASSGDFRNYGGSVRAIRKDGLTHFTLKYSAFNPYNLLPDDDHDLETELPDVISPDASVSVSAADTLDKDAATAAAAAATAATAAHAALVATQKAKTKVAAQALATKTANAATASAKAATKAASDVTKIQALLKAAKTSADKAAITKSLTSAQKSAAAAKASSTAAAADAASAKKIADAKQ